LRMQSAHKRRRGGKHGRTEEVEQEKRVKKRWEISRHKTRNGLTKRERKLAELPERIRARKRH